MKPFDEFCKQYNAEFIYKAYKDFVIKSKDIRSKYFNNNERSYLSTKIVLEGIYKKDRCHMTVRWDKYNAVWNLTSSDGMSLITSYSDERKSSPILKKFLPDCSVAYMGIAEISDSYNGLSNNPASHFAMNSYAAYEAYDLTASVSALNKLGFTKNVGDIIPSSVSNFVINTLTDLGTETFGGAQMETFYMDGNSQE